MIKISKIFATFLISAIVMMSAFATDSVQAATVKINNNKTVIVQVGQRKTIKVSGTKKARWYISNNSTRNTKTNEAILYSKKSTSVRIKGTKKGTSYIRVYANRKWYKVKVVVSNKKATSSKSNTSTKTNSSNNCQYILNTNSKKIHRENCRTIHSMNECNKCKYKGNINDLLKKGYTKCKVCNP